MIVLCIVFDLWGTQVRLVKPNWVYPLQIKNIIIIIIIIIIIYAILWHNSELIVNFEPQYTIHCYLSPSARRWQNTFKQGVDILRKKNSWKIRWHDTFKIIDLIL